MTERMTSMPEQIACVQLPEQEAGLAQDEMIQTLGGIAIGLPIIPIILTYIIVDYVSEWWDSED